MLLLFQAFAADDPTPAAKAEPKDAEEAEGADDEAKAAGKEAEAEAEPTGPTTVTVGVHVNDIMAIDLRSHSFMADGYIWFRWKGDLDPASSMEFINPFELWGHMEEMNFEEPEELDDGTLYQVMRFQGGFSQKLPLYDYPFDKQTLTITFEDSVHPVSGVVYVGDGITLNPALNLPGFDIGKASLSIEPHLYETAFGDPRQKTPETYSRARVQVPIARPVLAYAIKLVLPVFCAAVSASLMFLLSPRWVDARTSIGITSLLTIVALQITGNEDLPEVGYLTLMDKLYVAAYAVVIAGLLAVVWSTKMLERDQEEQARRFDRRALAFIGTAFAITVIVLIRGAM